MTSLDVLLVNGDLDITETTNFMYFTNLSRLGILRCNTKSDYAEPGPRPKNLATCSRSFKDSANT